MLELRNVCKTYPSGFLSRRSRVVLNDFSMKLERGSIVGITGESGSGKTTIAKIALRLINPSSGSIILDDVDITRLSMEKMRPYRKSMQIVFQHPEGALDPKYRIGESIKEALLKAGAPQENIAARIAEACSQANLPQGLLDRYPSQVSGGEIQRAAFARALAFEPDYMFLDEPTSMLDVSVQAYILNLIRSESSRRSMGVALITHDLDIIRSMCSETILISRGEMVACGTTDDVLRGNGDERVSKLVLAWDAQKNVTALHP